MPEKIIKQTLSEQIYNILKEDILSGRILMGDKLTNRELQERFQVSSTPVRDAINRLSKDGLTQEVSKSGAQLITFDYSYANELNDFIHLKLFYQFFCIRLCGRKHQSPTGKKCDEVIEFVGVGIIKGDKLCSAF